MEFFLIKTDRNNQLDKTREPVIRTDLAAYYLPYGNKFELEARLSALDIFPGDLALVNYYAEGKYAHHLGTSQGEYKASFGIGVVLGGSFNMKQYGHDKGELYFQVNVLGETNGSSVTQPRASVEVGVRISGFGDTNPHRVKKSVNKGEGDSTWLSRIFCSIGIFCPSGE